MKRDFYEVLDLSKSASQDEVKAAYRKKALEFHPDRNKSTDAEKNFKEVNEAYQVVGDPAKRKNYDQFGHAAFDQSAGFGGGGGNPFAGGFGQQGPFTYSYQSTGGGGNPFEGFDFGGGADPFEIFESFFGGGGNPFGGRAKRKPRYTLTIDFMDAAKGAEQTVSIEGKRHTIKIPAGADSGTRIRYSDFDITLSVKPDPTFRRDDYDVYVDQEIPLTMAILGGNAQVKTIDGNLTLKIRPGTQPNTMVRLREQGIPYLQRKGRGDEYVRLIVKVPEHLSRRQRELMEELSSTID
ncbi:MAG: DnaJ C-terminal domain-containing protein, partial [Patescibacteria group bacterium]